MRFLFWLKMLGVHFWNSTFIFLLHSIYSNQWEWRLPYMISWTWVFTEIRDQALYLISVETAATSFLEFKVIEYAWPSFSFFFFFVYVCRHCLILILKSSFDYTTGRKKNKGRASFFLYFQHRRSGQYSCCEQAWINHQLLFSNGRDLNLSLSFAVMG